MATATANPKAASALDEFDPDEVAAVLAALREKKRREAEAAEAEATRKATGYPKRLYNSRYLGESILGPDGYNRITFHRGVLDVPDAETEAYVRQACPGRIFEADMPRERSCKKCDFVTASSDCWEAHESVHS